MTRPHANVLRFACEKRPATGSRGMVVTNHPMASAAGAEILLGGGNAVDAAVAALFALTIVEPMMVGVLGGGLSHIRLADGRHTVVDCLSTAPSAAKPAMYEPTSDGLATARSVARRENDVGAKSVATPGNLAGWCHSLARYGTRSLATVMAPAIRLAAEGFTVSPYLHECTTTRADDIATDPAMAALFLPGGAALAAGSRLVQADAAATLRAIAENGPGWLHGGTLGKRVANHLQEHGGAVSLEDLAAFLPLERAPIRGLYRGHTIIGPPPPASSGVHIAQMLNILEGFDLKALGFGTCETSHLLAEVLKIAFADRAVATADPAFVDVPVERLISKAYAEERRASLDPARAQRWTAGQLRSNESANTTHVTVADADGNVVSATHTINGLFGACVMIPGTGLIANNYMFNFDPHPGRALSIAPGKRVFTSMAPMMIAADGKILHALGLPGGLRIFPSAFQAIINLLDHSMDTQSAVEAPRLWCEGGPLELEPGFPADVATALEAKGHTIQRMLHIGGGMNAISFLPDGTMAGAACWRADGAPVGISGGLARRGVRFSAV